MSKFTIETEELSEGMKNAIDYYFARGQRITIAEIAAISQAISLKRIADVLEHNTELVTKLTACINEDKNMVRVDSF